MMSMGMLVGSSVLGLLRHMNSKYYPKPFPNWFNSLPTHRHEKPSISVLDMQQVPHYAKREPSDASNLQHVNFQGSYNSNYKNQLDVFSLLCTPHVSHHHAVHILYPSKKRTNWPMRYPRSHNMVHLRKHALYETRLKNRNNSETWAVFPQNSFLIWRGAKICLVHF